MANALRIALYNEYDRYFNFGQSQIAVVGPPLLASSNWKQTEHDEWNNLARCEVLRLLEKRSCLHCATPMTEIDGHPGIVLGCKNCGYWGGRGTRDWGAGPADNRGVLGLIHHMPLNSDAVPLENILKHLLDIPEHLLALDPFRAEKVVADVLHEALGCEVRLIGGRKDGGVDAYLVQGNNLATIVQVKWHSTKTKAESVKVVREVAGTLLARGIPAGLLITTREKLSKSARDEVELINQREVVGVGKLHLDYKSYNDVLDILELAWGNMGANLLASNPLLDPSNGCIFG